MKTSLLLPTQIGFVAVTLIYFYILLKLLIQGVDQTFWSSRKKQIFKYAVIAVPMLIALFDSIWSLSGVMARFELFPFNFMPVLAVPFVIAIWIGFSKDFSDILHNIPVATIIRLQSFRFFVEILLLMLYLNNSAPIQMTFEGRNFDILVGITAPLVAWLTTKQKISKWALILWNICSLGLLVNIVTIAILSTPTPIRVFMNEPANTIVAYFPISWLPGLLVPLAFTLHVLSLKQLLADQKPVATHTIL
jgi:hypothetical protein